MDVCYSSLVLCEVGVRQGDNLSSLLFFTCVNELKTCSQNQCNGMSFLSNSLERSAVLHADKTIILKESEEDLQKASKSHIKFSIALVSV